MLVALGSGNAGVWAKMGEIPWVWLMYCWLGRKEDDIPLINTLASALQGLFATLEVW